MMLEMPESGVVYMPRKPTNRVWDQPKKKKGTAPNKAERSWRSEERFGISYGDAEFGVGPACFKACFGPVFSVLISPFWHSSVYSVTLYVASI